MESTTTVGDRNKFGTYHRDQTGLDYADQRYYNSAIGRFMSSDPYEASGGTSSLGSWGHQPYVEGDPVNFFDPTGRVLQSPDFCPAEFQKCDDGPVGGGGGGGGGGGSGSSLVAPNIRTGSWSSVESIARNTIILRAAYTSLRGASENGQQPFVTHLQVTVDCYTIDSRTSKPARKIKYVAYRGEDSLEGDARVSIQEFVLGSNGSPADVLDPFSIGRRGRFSDSLGVGPFGSSPGIAYQYFRL